MNDFAIRAENVSKFYRIQKKQKHKMLRDRVQDLVLSGFRELFLGGEGAKNDNMISALHKVDFEIKHGESMGIIGANGAGKTTLLKILARVTAPSNGRIRMRGRIGSLLEVGTGFHTELTGRENVYLNGAVLGMRKKEIDRKFDEIVDFSGIEEFIDTPVKHYSSGMRMRLAFSVAAHLDTEILLVDEVLAVGDVAFQNKSLGKMEKVTEEGRTVLFVSHNLAAVKSLCPQCIFLEHGKLKFMGNTEKAVQMYLQDSEVLTKDDAVMESGKRAQILNVIPCDSEGNHAQAFPHTRPIHIHIRAYMNMATAFKTYLTLKIYTSNLENLITTHDFESEAGSLIPLERGIYEFQVQIPPHLLNPGRYYVGAQITRHGKNSKIRPIHKLDHSTEFEVYDNGSRLSQFNIPWEGLIHHPDVKWIKLNRNGS